MIGVRFPSWSAGHGYGFVEFARRHGDFAIASAAVLLEEDANGKITRASLTLGGVAVVPQRMRNVEKALVGQIASEDVFRAACEECRKVEAIEDVHAPASYRQHLAAVLSISIGLINLFPIPLLDGGHLMYYIAEALRGRPLSERVQEYGFRVGLAFVIGLMIFATFNDILNLTRG